MMNKCKKVDQVDKINGMDKMDNLLVTCMAMNESLVSALL